MITMHEIVSKIMTDLSGGTVRLDGGEVPATGYMVGHGRQGLSLPATMVTRALVWEVVAYLTDTRGVRYLGWWVDQESNRFFLEPSDWTANYNHAVQMASEREELAFYDIARGADIRMDQPAA